MRRFLLKKKTTIQLQNRLSIRNVCNHFQHVVMMWWRRKWKSVVKQCLSNSRIIPHDATTNIKKDSLHIHAFIHLNSTRFDCFVPFEYFGWCFFFVCFGLSMSKAAAHVFFFFFCFFGFIVFIGSERNKMFYVPKNVKLLTWLRSLSLYLESNRVTSLRNATAHIASAYKTYSIEMINWGILQNATNDEQQSFILRFSNVL